MIINFANSHASLILHYHVQQFKDTISSEQYPGFLLVKLAWNSSLIKFHHLPVDKIVNFLALLPLITPIIIQNNFNSFSLIDLHQNATLPDCFQGDRLRVIGNCWNKQNIVLPFLLFRLCIGCILTLFI